MWIVRYTRLSSAKSLMPVPAERFLLMSFMYVRKRSGPRTVPWGTPESTGAGADVAPSTSTDCSRKERKERIHFSRGPPIPREESLKRSFL